jgi:hypothetical protein
MTQERAMQEPRHKTGPTMKTQADGKQPPPPLPVDVMVADDPWHPMNSAPKDGTYLFLRGDPMNNEKEIPNEWFWYRTRQFRKGTWQQTGWWRRRFGPAVAPSFTPEGWVSVKEGLPR